MSLREDSWAGSAAAVPEGRIVLLLGLEMKINRVKSQCGFVDIVDHTGFLDQCTSGYCFYIMPQLFKLMQPMGESMYCLLIPAPEQRLSNHCFATLYLGTGSLSSLEFLQCTWGCSESNTQQLKNFEGWCLFFSLSRLKSLSKTKEWKCKGWKHRCLSTLM